MKLDKNILSIEDEELFIPDVVLPTDEGKKRNRNLPEDIQVKAALTTPTMAQKSEYIRTKTKKGESTTEILYERALSRHCKSIIGLADAGVTDAASLWQASQKNRFMASILEDIVSKILGVHEDDQDDEDDLGE